MKLSPDTVICTRYTSHPARGAWIEIVNSHRMGVPLVVAPRKGCVD